MFTYAMLAWAMLLALIAAVADACNQVEIADHLAGAGRVALVLATAMLLGSAALSGAIRATVKSH